MHNSFFNLTTSIKVKEKSIKVLNPIVCLLKINDQQIACASWDKPIEIWNVKTGLINQKFKEKVSEINSLIRFSD